MLQAFFQALVITLREGFEAFLIVAISLSYLRKSGRARLTPAVHWGIAAAIVVSGIGGAPVVLPAHQAMLLGSAAAVAGACLASGNRLTRVAARRAQRGTH